MSEIKSINRKKVAFKVSSNNKGTLVFNEDLGNNKRAKRIKFRIMSKDLPRGLHQDTYVNVRNANITTRTVKSMKSVLNSDNKAMFSVYNQGILMSARDFKIEHKKDGDYIVADMSDKELHDIIDGGHTYAVNTLGNFENNESEVEVDIIASKDFDKKIITDISAKRNNMMPVKRIDMFNTTEESDWVKSLIEKNAPILYNNVAFKSGTKNKICNYINILRILNLFSRSNIEYSSTTGAFPHSNCVISSSHPDTTIRNTIKDNKEYFKKNEKFYFHDLFHYASILETALINHFESVQRKYDTETPFKTNPRFKWIKGRKSHKLIEMNNVYTDTKEIKEASYRQFQHLITLASFSALFAFIKVEKSVLESENISKQVRKNYKCPTVFKWRDNTEELLKKHMPLIVRNIEKHIVLNNIYEFTNTSNTTYANMIDIKSIATETNDILFKTEEFRQDFLAEYNDLKSNVEEILIHQAQN